VSSNNMSSKRRHLPPVRYSSDWWCLLHITTFTTRLMLQNLFLWVKGH
jgi:hypothetical protein